MTKVARNQIIFGGLLLLSSAFTKALDLPLTDANFKQCVQELAQKKNWQQVAEIKKK